MRHELEEDILEVLVAKEEIISLTKELGERITKDYRGKRPLLIGILKGACPFMSDLIQAIPLDLTIDFMAVSSYGQSSKSTGEVRILKDLDATVEDRDILIVEDIIDSGNTLFYLKNLLLSRGAKSVELVTLLNKPERRTREIEVKYIGRDIPDHFVVGYGLDFNETYRNLPYIGILKPEVYS